MRGIKMRQRLIFIGILFLSVIFCTSCAGKKKEVQKKQSNQKAVVSDSAIQIDRQDEAAIAGKAEAILKNMTVAEKVGQLFMVNLEALDQSHGSYYEFRTLTKKMRKKLRQNLIGGVCLFSRNLDTRKQTMHLIAQLQKESKIPLFIAVDEEGGTVSRIASNPNLGTTKFPTMQEVGEQNDPAYAYQIGHTIGKEIKELGFNVDFAPVADVKTNIYNQEIGSRSFGEDPDLVAKMVVQIVKGLQRSGVAATLKHFPGHGDVEGDSHKAPVNVETDIRHLRKVEFIPFMAGIKADADFIMVSHLSLSRVTESTMPASLSSLVLEDMLRTELGFKGVTITDALNLKAITEQYSASQAAKMAFSAGADMLLMPEQFKEAYIAVFQAVSNGEISQKRLNTSVRRILMEKVKLGLL